MTFLHTDLGTLSANSVVVVHLGTAANVRVLDDSNFRSYQTGGRHHFYGGHYQRTPVRIPIPISGHWHVVIDLGGHAGTIRASVDVRQPSWS
jgi:hypothetical protein